MAPTAESETTYSHDVAVTAITQFYNFAGRLFGSWVGLEHPPEGGWPQITPDLAEPMGLSTEAIQLVRHIPHFIYNPPCIKTDCKPRNFPQVCQYYRATLGKTGKPPRQIHDDHPVMDRG